MPEATLGTDLPSQDALDRLIGAIDAAVKTLPDDVFACLGPDGPDDGLEGAVRLIAQAQASEAAGDRGAADRLMDLAAASGPGHPMLLRAIAGHCISRGDAQGALAVLAPLTAERTDAAMVAADPVRHAATELRSVLDGDHPRFGGPALHKARLRATLGVEGAAVLMAGCSHPDHPRVARRVARAALGAFSHAHGSEVRVLAPARRVLQRSPEVVGRATGPTIQGDTREVVVAALDDVVVSSHANLLLTGSVGLLDVTDREWSTMEPWLDLDPAIAAFGGSDLIALAPRREPPTLETAISLVGVSSAAFGHLMEEFLPRLWAIGTQPDLARVPVLVDAQMPPQHHQAIRHFAGPERRVVSLPPGASVRVRRLWSCTMPCYLPLGPAPGVPVPTDLPTWDPDLLASLLRGLDHPEPPRGTPIRRGVYLSRRDFPRRRLVNEAELEEALARRGFLIIDPATLTFVEQVALVRSARTIVAADGSTNYLVLFARPGTRVAVLSHGFAEGWGAFAELFAALDLPFRMVTGTIARLDPSYRWFSDYHIDPAALDALLDASW